MDEHLISVPEAAAMFNYNVDYFRRKFLNPEHPVIQPVCLPSKPGARKRCKIQLRASEVLKILRGGK